MKLINSCCENCNKPISYRLNKSKHHFCSQTCFGIFSNKHRIRHKWSDEQRAAFSLSQKQKCGNKPLIYGKCIVCNGAFSKRYESYVRATCSHECKQKLLSQKHTEYLKKIMCLPRGPRKQSYMEESFEQWLLNKGIKHGMHGYLTEIHFYNAHTKKHGFADFVFPKKRLIIELDGTQHQRRKELDDIRDAHLSARGWKVVRIPIAEYIKKTKVNYIESLL